MALPESVTNAMEKVRGLFNREPKAMDAFGGDDLFDGDGEAKAANLGPKIALAVSGVFLLALASLIAVIVMTGDPEVANTGGSLDGLTLEDDEATVAGTERSVERRPWLTPTDNGGTRRLGVSDTAKTDDKKAEAKTAPDTQTKMAGNLPTREVGKVETMKPPPAGQDTQAGKQPEAAKTPVANVEVAKTEEPKAEPVKTEPAKADAPKSPEELLAQIKSSSPETAPAKNQPGVAAPEAKTAEAPAKATAPETAVAMAPSKPGPTKAAPMPAVDKSAEPVEEQQQAAMPSLLAPALTAPGAPRRFESDDGNAVPSGGRPRLNGPRLPPTDRTSVGTPPPRFTALAAIKGPEPSATSAAKVAIVVEGLGLNRAATEAALAKLPASVTFAFSPYARDLKKWLARAKEKGHEVLIEVPMESKAFPAEDPGPLGLLTSLESADNQERLDTILKEATGATGATGVFDGMGSKFRESQRHIGEVLAKLKQQNLFYVQGRPGIRVGDTEVPSATTDVVIDERPFRAAVDARPDYAERLAKYQGSAVAVMSARPISFERLALWSDQLAKKGVTLAAVSQVLVQ
ncbi:MAG: divergent polysaccharide deacetylase family protein [Rhodospirillaceae bacterium]|nr:divergent polysaccharide deacetylase family protein [Rhodospirillaceae bacterium]